MTLPSDASASDSPDACSFDFNGRIIRKKNISAEYLKLAIQQDGEEKSTMVYISRHEPVCIPSGSNFLYLGAVIRVRGRVNTEKYHHVTQCHLVKCAPNAKMIKEILALPNYLSLAATVGYDTDEGELQRLVEGAKSQKAAVNCIIEKLTGKRAKAPPRYRPGRVKRSDMDVLERKEAEGRTGDDDDEGSDRKGWRLCQPCRSLDDALSFDRKRESVVNLPSGADDSISAHGKLTRSEYLETKKNNQATWFVERMGRFEGGPPARFLDVGGGRGDLAVRIASRFPETRGVVVDSNESSVLAGREYAARCGVDDRVEFVRANFEDYVEEYDAGRRGRVDLVVALHACGDLSDMALSFSSAQRCDFIICPCCYPKRYLAPFVPHWHNFCTDVEVDSLSRLVELDDHGEVSRRAMLVVNSMRKNAFGDRKVELEEFDSKISKRNIALVGTAS